MKYSGFFRPRWTVVIPLALLLASVTEGGCKRSPESLTAFVVAAPLLSLWATHAAMLTGRLQKQAWRFPTLFLHDLVFTLLLSALAHFLLPVECNGSRQVQEILTTVAPAQQEIAAALAAGKAVTPRDEFSPADIPGAAYLRVSAAGTLMLLTRKPVAFVEMQARMKGNRVDWNCHGHPLELMPDRCRSAKP